MKRSLFYTIIMIIALVTAALPVAAQDDTTWRVRRVDSGSYGPELELSRPGVGTNPDEIATMVGDTLVFQTRKGEVTLDGGCQQAVIMPDVYARNSGGWDFGFVVWQINTSINPHLTPENILQNEAGVLSWQLSKQQIDKEECENLSDVELLDHVYVVTQDKNGDDVVLTPWSEFRRASGENAVMMIFPGDRVVGWHIGLGLNSENNLCDDGGCLLEESPTFGWCGGCAAQPYAKESEFEPISEKEIAKVVKSLKPADFPPATEESATPTPTATKKAKV